MTTSVFSTIDHLTSRLKPLDRLITIATSRLLPQHEARAAGCAFGFYPVDECNQYCLPTSDLRYAKDLWCYSYNPGVAPYYAGRTCCDCC
jgi:hypothetical protein